MRHYTRLPLLLMALLLIGILPAKSGTFQDGDLYYNVLSESEKTVELIPWPDVEYTGAVEIPSVVTGNGTEYTVVAIGEKAIEWNMKLESVSMPATLTSIGSNAFYGCRKISTLTVPQGVTHIGAEAFSQCARLVDVKLPESLSVIEIQLFAGCEALKTVTMPVSLKSINAFAFNYCYAIEEITIPDGVISIGDGAFSYCQNLKNVHLGSGLEYIGISAFEYCESLASITIPKSVTSLAGNAFKGCVSLNALNVDSENKVFASYDGVLYMKGLKTLVMCPAGRVNVTIPDGVTHINNRAFAGSSIEKVDGGKDLVAIEDYAFDDCKSLSKVVLGDNLTTLGEGVFSGSAIEEIALPQSLATIGNYAFSACSQLRTITVPAKVKELGHYCFFGCKSLTSVEIGGSVNYIGEYAFRGCQELKSLTCRPVDPPYCVSEFTSMQYEFLQVFVPEKAVGAYKQANHWKDFANIEAIVPVTLALSVAEITDQSAEVTGTPSDDGVYWFANVVLKEDYAGDEVWRSHVELWKQEAAAAGSDWMDIYRQKARTGKSTFTFEGLESESGYIAYGFGLDETGALCMPVVTIDFTTADSPEPVTLFLAVDEITDKAARVTGTPSDDSVYWFANVVLKENYAGDEVWSSHVELWKQEAEAAGSDWKDIYRQQARTGKSSFYFEDLKGETGYIAYGFGLDETGALCMPVVSVDFKTNKTVDVLSAVRGELDVYSSGMDIMIDGDFVNAEAYTLDGRIAGVFTANKCRVDQKGYYIVRVQTADRVHIVKTFVK